MSGKIIFIKIGQDKRDNKGKNKKTLGLLRSHSWEKIQWNYSKKNQG